MGNGRLQQKILQSLYRPSKSKFFSNETMNSLNEIEQVLEKAINKGKDTIKYFKEHR